MNWEGWFTLAVIALVFSALVRNWGPPDAVLLGGGMLTALAGIIGPTEVFSGFVNQGTLTIAALLVVAMALRETGVLDLVGTWVFGKARTEKAGLIRLILPAAAMSAFLNNTPIVAMFMPVASNWCRRHGISPSRLLMPLSFAAILGGACTLIGTSTNLVINGLMIQASANDPALASNLRPMTLFEMAGVGVPFAVVGLIYLFVVGNRLLPQRTLLMERLEASPREYLADMKVEPGCRLIGQNVEEAGLRRLPGLFLTEIERRNHPITPVTPREIIEEDDILTFTGVVGTIVDLERIEGLVPVADAGYETRAAERRGKNLCEAVISNQSPLIGKNIRDADFRAVYNAAVIAVHRGAERIEGRIGDIVLKSGDTLLLQTGAHFARGQRNNRDFFLVSDVEESRPVRHDRQFICFGLLVLLVGLMISNAIPIVLAAYTVAGMMVVTRCIPAGIARSNMDWETVLTIGASFGLGHALAASGAAPYLAQKLVAAAGTMGPYAVMTALYVITGVFAALVSSKASAVLMFPVALSAALAMDINPRPFIMAIAFSTATTFATPVGYPTNLMVYGPGGYRYTDFARVGLPLNFILLAMAIVLIPYFWPFTG